jgi:hypothetical protein
MIIEKESKENQKRIKRESKDKINPNVMCKCTNALVVAGIALILMVVLNRLRQIEGMESKEPACSMFTNGESCKYRKRCDWTLKKDSNDEYRCTKKEK